jgi:virginiamycin B lyase
VAAPPSRGGSKLPSPASSGGAASAGGADGAGADIPSPAADGGGDGDGGAGGGGTGGPAGVDFTASPSVAQVGETVTFTDASTGDHTVTGWSAPDGTPVASTNGANRFQTVFKAAGTFNVTLTVDAAGGAQSVTHQIKVDTQITLPDLHGLTFQQATKVLNDMGLSIGNQIEIVTTTLASGRIVNTDPPAGTAVSRGAVINYRSSAAQPYAEFPIPSAASNNGYHGITVGPDGNVWFTEISANIVARVTPDGKVTEFTVPIPNSHPWGIATGPDGNLWVALENASSVARITVTGNNAHFEPFPTRSVNSGPTGVALGRDGNLWVAEGFANKVAVFDPNGLLLQEFPMQTANSFPSDVVAGSDGFMYVGEVQGHKAAKFGTTGLVAELNIPGANGISLAPGPTGFVLWTNGTGEVGTLQLLGPGPGTTREFPTGHSVTSAALGSDGNIWYSGTGPDALVAIDNAGRALRTATADLTAKTPALLINGPGGMLWFIEVNAGRVGRVVI